MPSSTVSPDQEKARITSSRVIMPRSPWLASLGCTKDAGRAGGGEGAGDLQADMAALAHAGDDDPAAAGADDGDGFGEIVDEIAL